MKLIKRIRRKLKREALYRISLLVRFFTKVKPNLVLCWSNKGNYISCNPYYITQYIRNNSLNYDVVWMLAKNLELPIESNFINKIVRYGTLKYILAINMSEYVITNTRIDSKWAMWKKRKKQKYIMTWHSSMSIKKVEKDVNNYPDYLKMAKEDSARCDLILSGCEFRTQVIKRAFQYSGEILEKGTPRNDIFFDLKRIAELKKIIYTKYNISINKRIIIYAPTFRNDGNLDYVKLDWGRILNALREKMGQDFVAFLRLHPNMASKAKEVITDGCDVINVTNYNDMQELLVISDILITDFSSSIFDFALTLKPIFLYAIDASTYNRGTYFNLDELPFSFSTNQDDLLKSIMAFDKNEYEANLNSFLNNRIKSFENGHACEAFVHWMENKKIGC